MPTTRKLKKARKSRGLEMLSDIENLDIMLGENHFNTGGREGSLNGNSPRISRSFASNESENEDGNIGRNQRNANSRTNTDCDRNSVTGNSSAEINRESREMDEMMNSVSAQIQRAISDAISTQVLPQIQNVIMAGSGHGTKKGMGRSVRETGTKFRSSAKPKCKKQQK